MNINMKLSDNPSARSAYNAFCRTNCAIEKTLGILTSGLKINSSADDAAGLAISERMRSEMIGLEKVMSNLQDGMSLLQTAEGGLSGINAIVQRMRELAVQSANDTLTQSDRMALQSEFGEIRDEIDRIADTTQFNRKKLLNGNTSAIWSSNNPNVRVIINGSITSLDELGNMTSAEGNYNVSISAKAGQNEVQKTGLFSLSQDYLLDSYYGVIGTGLYYDTDSNEITTAEAVQGFNVNGNTGTTYAFSIINADDNTDVVNVKAKIPTFSTPDEFVEFMNSDGTNDGNTTLYGTDYEVFYNETLDKFGIRSTHNFTIDDSAGGYQKLFGTFENQEVPESQSTVIYEPASAVTSSSNLSAMSTRGVRLMSLSVSGPQTVTGAMTEDLDVTGTSTVTLDSATGGKNINIGAGANVTLNLTGTSTIGKITLGANSRLTIDGTGTLNGLIDAGDSGNITINGGTINATATTSNTAGIRVAEGSTLIINGGTVTAKGGSQAAGIGGVKDESSGTITINDGTVTATGGSQGAGIGGGYIVDEGVGKSLTESSGTITINGGTVTATGGTLGAGIGGGQHMSNGTITITGGTVTAKSPSNGTGIGGGSGGSGGTINISGGDVKAISEGDRGAGLGGGSSGGASHTTAGNINISGGKVEAQGGTSAAGIGVGIDGEGGNINISGGTIISKGGIYGAGIGGGKNAQGLDITISNGNITTEGGDYGAGIGGGQNSNAGNITISGGSITAKGGANSTSSIGVGAGGTEGSISIADGLYLPDNSGLLRVYNSDDSAGSINSGNSSGVTYTTVSSDITVDSGYIEEAIAGGTMANGNFRLSQLANFYDSEGRFLVENPQQIDIIQGDGRTASVTLYGEDTLGDVVSKLNNAISQGLGQSKYLTDSSGADKFATLVTEDNAAESTSESVVGSIVIRSAIAGSEGRLRFSGTEEMLKSLGLNTIQEATENEFEISISDAHDGKNTALSLKTTGNRLISALGQNIDIAFDPMTGINASWNDNIRKFTYSTQNTETTIHLKENTLNLQVGANEGETVNLGIGEVSSEGLNLNKLDITSREKAKEAIGTIDNALDKLSAQQAKVGALINRLEHSTKTAAVMHENVTNSESRIRDADEAKAMMDFTKLQIMFNVQNSVLSQANQQSQNVLSIIR